MKGIWEEKVPIIEELELMVEVILDKLASNNF
jgi:hypothetical protein